jgi:hypothetical protein
VITWVVGFYSANYVSNHQLRLTMTADCE